MWGSYGPVVLGYQFVGDKMKDIKLSVLVESFPLKSRLRVTRYKQYFG